MTSTIGRFYAIAVALVVFFLSWAVIAAQTRKEAASIAPDPRLAALDARERRLRAQAVTVNATVQRRWEAYRTALAERKREIATLQRIQQTAPASSAAAPTPAAAAPAPVVKVAPSAPAPAPATSTRTS